MAAPQSLEELENRLSDPGADVVRALTACPGDIVVLGAGGKMGPTLTRMAVRAADGDRRVVAVSKFTSGAAEAAIRAAGAETVRCDLLDPDAVAALPDAPNVIFMAGQKFGTADAPERTWAMNVTVPQICAVRYATSRIVAFSTGNVYPLVSISSGGAREADATEPVGTYAESCLARERIFEAAALRGTKVAIMRLNYAIALTYGVLTDVAVAVATGAPVSLSMGYVNVIWQGDANRAALGLLPHATSPARVVNVTGRDTLRVRDLAEALGRRLGRAPVFSGVESGDALLSDATLMASLVGAPDVGTDAMLDWTADWVANGRPLLGKPTKFGVRDGVF
ncbi:MAG: NAD-dependent epimerase/dehydratase family protein [Gemmatimonadota bacterium]|nr:NAD-dependent epimerase/dehydratase family protein [Gemmatimonadota bacterium]